MAVYPCGLQSFLPLVCRIYHRSNRLSSTFWKFFVFLWLALHFVRCTGWGLCQGHKGRKRRKRQGKWPSGGYGPWFFSSTGLPAGPLAVGGMVHSYFVPCPLRPLCPYPSFSRLSVSALHIVYCQPNLSFFRTDTIHIFPKTAIFQKIFLKCLKLPVKQYGTLF